MYQDVELKVVRRQSGEDGEEEEFRKYGERVLHHLVARLLLC